MLLPISPPTATASATAASTAPAARMFLLLVAPLGHFHLLLLLLDDRLLRDWLRLWHV